MSKQIAYQSKARKEIKLGLDALANAVKVTLGPGGRCVAYEKSWGAPGVTKDGVTVAKEISLAGKFQNLGCELVREVASRTNDDTPSGVGSTTINRSRPLRCDDGSDAVTPSTRNENSPMWNESPIASCAVAERRMPLAIRIPLLDPRSVIDSGIRRSTA